MIYAVNTRSKEHKELPDYFSQDASFYLENDGDRWDIIRADAEGWITWNGEVECPLPDNQEFEIRYKDGKEEKLSLPQVHSWQSAADRTGDRRWVAYRPILSEPSEPEAPRYVKVVGIDFSVYDWWTEGKQYEVIAKGGVEGVKADDGDFYPLDGGRLDGRRLARGGCFVPCSGEPDAPAWNGEGLPPVGCECEFEYLEVGTWLDAKVIGYDGPACVVAVDGCGYEGSQNPSDFRPKRPAAQREEDEAVEEMARIIADGHDVYIGAHGAAQRLYRAGYRKTATADGEDV